MSVAQRKEQNQKKQARLEIVAELYKKGYSIRRIRDAVIQQMNLKSCSTQTIHADIKELLKEWREYRLDNVDDLIQLELERIDDAVCELWEQWEKSKTDYKKISNKQKGRPKTNEQKRQEIETILVEKKDEEIIRLGNVSYIAEIRAQLAERRKILGIYAPEKKELSGEIKANISIVQMKTTVQTFASSENEVER